MKENEKYFFKMIKLIGRSDKMDMYQKRKMRAEKKQNDNQEENKQAVNLNWFPGHMAKTKREISEKLNLIDIVYEVIDARMPLSSKIVDIDDLVKDKPRILVVTKYDLCDKVQTDKILKYYESLGYKTISVDLMSGSGVSNLINMTKELMNEINSVRVSKGMKERSARVLIVGVPNVGKSTLINRLVGRKSAGVGNTPGFTKSLSWIRVNQDIELLDSPGILWPKFENQETAKILAALSSIKEEILNLDDIACFILNKLYELYPEKLEERYGITEIDEDFIETYDIIAKRRGALSRGGVADYEKVSNIIIKDLKNGYFGNITLDRLK
jgi:ribosome biogenesis GTPase A